MKCFVCDGDKRIIIGEPDPVEGHKFSERVNCPACRGRGEATMGTAFYDACKAFWEARDRELREQLRKKREDAKVKLRAMTKVKRHLSIDEMRALGRVITQEEIDAVAEQARDDKTRRVM